mmetsp:Transcript_71678/g.201037  ORF Transcript_71678/g.201037 Transcript_71678/m.201037 type:complete len:336 (+) Transcript_71678:429-1436(+)
MLRVEFDNPLQKPGVGQMTNGHKHSITSQVTCLSAHRILQDDSRHDLGTTAIQVHILFVVAPGCIIVQDFSCNLFDDSIPFHRNGRMALDAIRQDLTGSKGIPTMDQSHLVTGSSQYQGIFHGRISSSDHQNMLVGVQESITRGTGADTSTSHFILSFHAQPFGIGTCRYNDRMGFNRSRRIGQYLQGSRRYIDSHDPIFFKDGTKMGRLLTHGRNYGRTRYIAQARVVLHIHTLALQLPSHTGSQDQRRQACTRRIDRGGQSRRTPSDDGDTFGKVSRAGPPIMIVHGFFVFIRFVLQLSIPFFVQALFQFGLQFLFGRQLQIRTCLFIVVAAG